MNRSAAERLLRAKVIRLAHENPALRPHLLPLLVASSEGTEAGRTWGGSKAKRTPDDAVPYNCHGTLEKQDDGSEICRQPSKLGPSTSKADRAKYNKNFRREVCPDHSTECGDPGRDWGSG